MENQTELVYIILLGCLIMFLLVMVVIVFMVTYGKRLREKDAAYKLEIKNKELELLRQVIQAKEMERETLATGLHDEIGPLLSVLKLNMSKHMKSFEKETLQIHHFDEERQFIDEIITNVRRLSHELTPHFVTKKGLVFGLRNLAKATNDFSIIIDNQSVCVDALKSQTALNAYRIILELINNLIKHEKISELKIVVKDSDGYVEAHLIHKGKGISNDEIQQKMNESKGLGLSSIQLRLLVLNAELLYFEKAVSKIILKIPKEQDEIYTHSYS